MIANPHKQTLHAAGYRHELARLLADMQGSELLPLPGKAVPRTPVPS